MAYASSACSTCSAWASMEECTATVRTASRRQVRITRQAISPRLAIRTLENMAAIVSGRTFLARPPHPGGWGAAGWVRLDLLNGHALNGQGRRLGGEGSGNCESYFRVERTGSGVL